MLRVAPSTLPDAMSAEYAIGAVEAMLPAILQLLTHRASRSEREGCRRNQMLMTYADVAEQQWKPRRAHGLLPKIRKPLVLPSCILEISHDLWTYRKREGQPLTSLSLARGIEADVNGP
jgi:hypothetical protein